jgi:hypothetical protein
MDAISISLGRGIPNRTSLIFTASVVMIRLYTYRKQI